MDTPALSVVIPAYNEAVHLYDVAAAIARALAAAGIDYEVCIVNNGSTDGTADVIARLERDDPRITHLAFAQNQGYGGGIRAGLDKARGAVLGWIHADGQAQPADIVGLYQKMRAEGTELGKAVRIVRHESPWRIVQSRIYHAIFYMLFRTSYRDVNGTPRLMTRSGYERLKLTSRDWFLEPEFVIKSIKLGMPITELETIWSARRSGSTRARVWTGLEFLKNMILYRIGAK